MKLLLSIILTLTTASLLGQNSHLNIGIKGNGICLGNSASHNGIRLNLWDENIFKTNGLKITTFSESQHQNGISVGLLVSMDSVSNGIEIGGLATKLHKHTGLAIGGLGLNGERLTGVGLTGLSIHADTLNGLFIGTFGIMPKNIPESNSVIRGVTISGGVLAASMSGLSLAYFLNKFNKQKGVSIASINITNELHGVQFGLLNCAMNNRRIFRWTPFLNFNFRKKHIA